MINERKTFLARLKQAPTGAALVCVVIDLGDLHRSDRVARTLGPGYTDGLVRAAQARIAEVIGAGLASAQVDLDCVAFVLSDPDISRSQKHIPALLDELRRPLQCDGLSGAVNPSAGLVRFRVGQEDPQAVLQAAIAAAQDARDHDSGWRLHEGGMPEPGGRLHTVLADFPRALAAPDELFLVYQPRVSLLSGLCLGTEALLRWNHPSLGAISPGEFIPIAEQTGLARLVTDWVIERALGDLLAWTQKGFFHSVSINVSAVNLAEPDFAVRLGAAIGRQGIDPSRLELEFTEGALVRNTPRMRAMVADLAALGVDIAIDDFGTGYSNLQYLRDIPADTLKIDQSFIRSLRSNPRDRIIVRSMIALAHELGHRLVAEGIEDADALALLAEWGCDEGQGFHICRPIPLTGLITWLTERRAATPALAG
jgi:EAL domain-containing protein (putative c-di-GMP-specific phosphodiesterase class I)